MNSWVYNLIGLLVCAVLAYFVPTLLPGMIGTIVGILLGIGALVFAIFLVVGLLRRGAPRA